MPQWGLPLQTSPKLLRINSRDWATGGRASLQVSELRQSQHLPECTHHSSREGFQSHLRSTILHLQDGGNSSMIATQPCLCMRMITPVCQPFAVLPEHHATWDKKPANGLSLAEKWRSDPTSERDAPRTESTLWTAHIWPIAKYWLLGLKKN